MLKLAVRSVVIKLLIKASGLKNRWRTAAVQKLCSNFSQGLGIGLQRSSQYPFPQRC